MLLYAALFVVKIETALLQCPGSVVKLHAAMYMPAQQQEVQSSKWTGI